MSVPKITPALRLHLARTAWGWVPTQGQAQVILSDALNKTVVCGRRWGKTESGAIDDVTSLLTQENWLSMVVAPSRDQVMINFKTARELLDKFPDVKGIYQCTETPHPQITIKTDKGIRQILYRTAGDDGKYIRGHGAILKTKMKRIRVDEAAFIKDYVIRNVIEPMCLDDGAELILQGTPFGKNHFYARYREGDKTDSLYNSYCESFHFPTASNPHKNDLAFERIRQSLGEDSLQWKCEYLAEFIDSASAVFDWDLIESCFYDPYDGSGNKRVFSTYMAGIDLARYSDYTVVLLGGFDRGQLWVSDMDRFNQQDWVAQKARIFDIVQRYKAVGAIDSTGEGDAVVDDLVVGEFAGDEKGKVRQRPGLALDKVRITSNAIKRDLIDKLHVRMSQGLIKIPYGSPDSSTGEDKWNLLVDELKYYTYTMTDTGRITFQADSSHHDDCVMALALMNKRAFGNFELRHTVESPSPDTWIGTCKMLDDARKQNQRLVIGA